MIKTSTLTALLVFSNHGVIKVLIIFNLPNTKGLNGVLSLSHLKICCQRLSSQGRPNLASPSYVSIIIGTI